MQLQAVFFIMQIERIILAAMALVRVRILHVNMFFFYLSSHVIKLFHQIYLFISLRKSAVKTQPKWVNAQKKRCTEEKVHRDTHR